MLPNGSTQVANLDSPATNNEPQPDIVEMVGKAFNEPKVR
jgi:hypothetical protein